MASEALFKKIFSTIDKDGDGTISETEVSTYFKAMGLSFSESSVKACVKLYDTDGDGTIDMDEFVNVTKKTCNSLLKNEKGAIDVIQQVFGSEGIVTEGKLKTMFSVHGYNASAQEISDLLKQSDANGDGDVTFEEFLSKMAEIILQK